MSSRFLIDSNMIQEPELAAFLACDPGNRAVVSMEIWFELYKQRCVDGLRRGLDIMGRYPDQLIVLRASGEIMRLDPSVSDRLERMVLPDAGCSMRQMVDALAPERDADPALMVALKAKWDEAADQNRGMMEGAFDIRASLPEMQAQIFSANEIRIIRKGQSYTQPMFRSIFGAAEQLWEVLPKAWGSPSREHASVKASTLQFRVALGIVINLLWWISRGSQSKKDLEATRNDVIDIFLAAQASYFDGFLSNDDKARWIYDHLQDMLEIYRDGSFRRA